MGAAHIRYGTIYEDFSKLLKENLSKEVERLQGVVRTAKTKKAFGHKRETKLTIALSKAENDKARMLVNEQIETELPEIKLDIIRADRQIKDAQEKLQRLRGATLGYEEYEKMMEELPQQFQRVRESQDVERLNTVLTSFFSNFYVTGKKITGHRFTEPYDRLLSSSNFDLVGNTGLEPVTSTMSMWRSNHLS